MKRTHAKHAAQHQTTSASLLVFWLFRRASGPPETPFLAVGNPPILCKISENSRFRVDYCTYYISKNSVIIPILAAIRSARIWGYSRYPSWGKWGVVGGPK